MAAFDERQFSKSVQKREQARRTKASKDSTSTSSYGFNWRRKDKTAAKKDKNSIIFEDSNNNDCYLREKLGALPSSGKQTSNNNSATDESTMKKRLLGKIFKILQIRESSSSKKCAEEKRKVYRKRSRSSQSSTPSNFEPMPTIFEEAGEEDTISMASYEEKHTQIIIAA